MLVSRVAALLVLSALFLAVSSNPVRTLKQFDMRRASGAYLKTAKFWNGPSSSRPGPSSTSSRGPSPSPRAHGYITNTVQLTGHGFGATTSPVAPAYGSRTQSGIRGGWGD